MNLLKILNEVRLNGGVSYSLLSGQCNPDYGYMVSIRGHETVCSYVDEPLLKAYIAANSVELAKDDRFIGIWQGPDRNDPGKLVYYIDVSIHVDTLEQAITIGKENNQLAIWDNAKKDIVSL